MIKQLDSADSDVYIAVDLDLLCSKLSVAIVTVPRSVAEKNSSNYLTAGPEIDSRLLDSPLAIFITVVIKWTLNRSSSNISC